MELIVITSTLGHVDIIGCGILAYSIMETGKYVLFFIFLFFFANLKKGNIMINFAFIFPSSPYN